MKKILIGLALVMLLVSVSCGAAPDMEEKGRGEEAPIYPMVISPEEGDEVYSPEALSLDEERMIVRTGETSLVVEDVNQASDDIAQLAVSYGGYVVSSYIWGEEEDIRGWISFRVPAEKFDQALTDLRELAVRVETERTESRDVTEEYIDLESRLRNAEATEQQYLALLEKAEEIEDILKIYDSLSRIRSEIEQIKGRMQYLEQTTSTSLISVSLEPEVTAKPLVRVGWSALEVLKSAARGLVVAGQVLGNIAIWLLIFIPIWGTILGIILWRRHKRKAK